MRTTRTGTSILGLVIAAALALGACGDDNKGNGGNTGAAAPETTTDTTDTGTTGTTERERTGTTGEDRTTTNEGGDDKGGGGSGSGSGGGSNGGSDGSGSGSAEKPPQGNDVYSVARRVCNQFLPFITAKQLEDGKTTPQKVAGDYSRAFPKRQQKRAYDGCLKGLDDRGRA